MLRCVFRAQCAAGDEQKAALLAQAEAPRLRGLIDGGRLMTASVFRFNRHFFAYYECTGGFIAPDELFGGLSALLLKWPGGDGPRLWVPMADIYHCAEPVSPEYWRRARPPRRAYATVNRLRPEKLSSYIFYHYQYQEEKTGDFAKYASIFLHENLMFFYHEEPDGPEKTPYAGRLATANTPGEWEALMRPHFLPWEDDPETERPWREAETLLYL